MERSDVIVTGFRLNAAAPPARVLHTILGISEVDAKAMSKRFPCVVLADVEWAEAERVSLALRDAGAYAKLRAVNAKSEPPGPVEAPRTLPPAELEAPRTPAQPTAAAQRSEPAPPAAAAPRSESAPPPAAAAEAPTAVASPVLEKAAPGLSESALAAPAQAMMTSAARAAFELGHAPTLFSSPKQTETPGAEARASLPYALGELEIVATKSSPAPAMHSSPAPAKSVQAGPSQPAPATPAIKSQPAPAIKSQPAPAIKSQPAPAIKSQPAPAAKSQPAPAAGRPDIEAAGLRMLDDGFGGENTEGPALELDYGNVKTTGRVEYKQRGKISVREKEKPRGFWATLLLPIVLLQAAVPHALALTGVAAASGAAVYLARSSGEKKAGSAEETSLDADGKPRPRNKGGLMGLLDEVTGGAEDKTEGEQDPPTGESKAGAAQATEASHPLLKLAPKAMEPAIASILRQRIRGLHKVMIEWPEGTKADDSTQCMLLEQEHAGNLKLLLSTGRPVTPEAAVRDQLWDHIGTLRAARGEASATYIPICLAN